MKNGRIRPPIFVSETRKIGTLGPVEILAQVAFTNAAVAASREQELGDVLAFFSARIVRLRGQGETAAADALEQIGQLLAEGEHR